MRRHDHDFRPRHDDRPRDADDHRTGGGYAGSAYSQRRDRGYSEIGYEGLREGPRPDPYARDFHRYDAGYRHRDERRYDRERYGRDDDFRPRDRYERDPYADARYGGADIGNSDRGGIDRRRQPYDRRYDDVRRAYNHGGPDRDMDLHRGGAYDRGFYDQSRGGTRTWIGDEDASRRPRTEDRHAPAYAMSPSNAYDRRRHYGRGRNGRGMPDDWGDREGRSYPLPNAERW